MASQYNISTGNQPLNLTVFQQTCMRIKSNGYNVIPLFRGKTTPPKGWPTLPNDPADIAEWRGGAAAIRTYGSEILVIDIDVLLAGACKAIVNMLEQRWPAFMASCLRRHSGGVKLALIGRVKTDKRYLHTWRYRDPALPPEDKTSHRVEIFTGNTKKYVGVYGKHSEGREYGYYGPTILDMAAGTLPEFPAADLGSMIDACDAILAEHGLQAVKPAYGKTDKKIIYDIDDATRFDVDGGPDQTGYDTLVSMVAERGEVRVSGSFIDGSHDRTKCRASHCAIARCVGVWDNELLQWHCPKSEAPEAIAAALGAQLRELAAAHPEEVIKPGMPNWRERYKKGQPKASYHNAMLAIEAIGLSCFEDVFHVRMQLLAQPRSVGADLAGTLSDAIVERLRLRLSQTYGFDLTEKHVRDAAVALAREHPFDPVIDLLDRAEENWDGVVRLDRMAAELLSCEDTPFNNASVLKFMIAAARRPRHPGCKFDTIPVFESIEGWNKSTALRVLAGNDNFSDAGILGAGAREVQEHLGGVWIHEIADLAGMRKAEVEAVKAFASRTNDRARPVYGHLLIDQPRRGVIAGTTNGDRYLQSQTGNRRFWPIRLIEPIDTERLAFVRLQLWGEAARREKSGESLVLPAELWGAAAAEQEERRRIHPWEAKLEGLTAYRKDAVYRKGERELAVVHDTATGVCVSTADIFEECLNMPGWRQGGFDGGTLTDVMRVLGWKSGRVSIMGKQVRGYFKGTVV